MMGLIDIFVRRHITLYTSVKYKKGDLMPPEFTPLSALLGGTLIGVSATLLMLTQGRIAGISGVFSGAAFAEPGDRAWRIWFVGGLIAAPVLYGLAGGDIVFDLSASWPLVVLGGFLVGLGTRLGSGCTSGHGVCGLSRLSPRSLAAVLVFMAAGMAATGLMRHGLGGAL